MMHCDGKCYLAKQFRKLEAEEQKERSRYPFPTQKLKLTEIAFLCPENIAAIISEVKPARSNHFLPEDQLYRFDYLANNFHPPQA